MVEQDVFVAPWGCIWHDERHHQACAAWPRLVEQRDALCGEDRRKVRELMYDHMPAAKVGEDAT